MNSIVIRLVVLNLIVVAEAAAASGGSGTRRSVRGSASVRSRSSRPSPAASRSPRATTGRSRFSTRARAGRRSGKRHDRAAASKTGDDARRLLRERIGRAIHAEIIANPGVMPDRKRLQEIARQQLKQAQAEGLIPADADFDPAADFAQSFDNGLSGGSLFGGENATAGSRRRPSRTSAPRSSRRGMYVPRRRQMYTPRRHSRPRSPSGRRGANSPAAPLPGLPGGSQTPDQLQRQLQRLLK